MPTGLCCFRRFVVIGALVGYESTGERVMLCVGVIRCGNICGVVPVYVWEVCWVAASFVELVTRRARL